MASLENRTKMTRRKRFQPARRWVCYFFRFFNVVETPYIFEAFLFIYFFVAPNRGAVFLLQNPTVRCGAEFSTWESFGAVRCRFGFRV